MQHRDNSDDRVATSNIAKGKEYPVNLSVGHPHHSFTALKTATVVYLYTKQHSYSERYGHQGDTKRYKSNHTTFGIDFVMDDTQV
jgi:hypothetical protein